LPYYLYTQESGKNRTLTYVAGRFVFRDDITQSDVESLTNLTFERYGNRLLCICMYICLWHRKPRDC